MMEIETPVSAVGGPLHSSKTAVNGGHTSRSAHVVEEIRKRFFTEVYPNSKGLRALWSFLEPFL